MSNPDFVSDSPTISRYAGFWTRFAALLLDGIILYIPNAILSAIVFAVFGLTPLWQEMEQLSRSGAPVDDGQATELMTRFFAAFVPSMILYTILSIVITWLYFALMESSTKQATLGKMACGIVVTDMNGKRISFGRATGRYFMKTFVSGILLIGYLMAAFTQRKQALHDLVAKTLVLRRR